MTEEAFLAALVEDDAAELYDNAPCAYVSALPDGTLVKVNGTFTAWTGHDRADVVGQRRFQDLLAPGDRIFYETHLAPLLRMQGFAREVAVEIVTSTGGRLPVLVNAILKLDDTGTPQIMRVALFDATERRAYEHELVAARRRGKLLLLDTDGPHTLGVRFGMTGRLVVEARRRAEESEARATELARTLQQSFLPPASPTIPGVDLGGAYRPAGDGSIVGGDFYDVFETGRGTWAIVIGDVCGKGPAAAVLTSLARYTVRAEAPRTPYPSAVLGALHTAFVRNAPRELCTALVVVVESGNRLSVASGGHPPAIRRFADGAFEAVGKPGTVIGMIDVPRHADTATVLGPGEILVLYTDGVTEARWQGEFFEEARLRAAIDRAAEGSAQDIADAVVAAALDFQHGIARDDIAVVVLRAPGR